MNNMKKYTIIICSCLGIMTSINGMSQKQQDQLDEKLVEYALGGSLSGVKYALEQGADVNTISYYGRTWRYTPLMAAAYSGDLDVIKFLLDHGANMNDKDKAGAIARRQNHTNAADFIRDYTYKLSRQLVVVKDSKGTGNAPSAPGKPDIFFKF